MQHTQEECPSASSVVRVNRTKLLMPDPNRIKGVQMTKKNQKLAKAGKPLPRKRKALTVQLGAFPCKEMACDKVSVQLRLTCPLPHRHAAH